MPARPDARRAGFMLLEVLAALALTAMLVAVVLPLVGQLLTRWWTGEPELEKTDGFIQAVYRLVDDVGEALPVVEVGGGKPVCDFSVEPGGIELVRPALGARAGLSLDAVSYRIVHREQSDALVRATTPYAPGATVAARSSGGGDVVIDGPYRMDFRVMAPDGSRRPTWNGEAAMPAGVELRIGSRLRPGEPPMTVPLPIGATGL